MMREGPFSLPDPGLKGRPTSRLWPPAHQPGVEHAHVHPFGQCGNEERFSDMILNRLDVRSVVDST